MKTIHMIGNAHLDPVWLWSWQEGFAENKATFRSALDRLKEYDGFVFTSSSAQFYAWIEENDPEMFQEIRTFVRQGRWTICGGWWVQPDCNLPCGESFARHALHAQNYFRQRFGVTARTGYNVDSFGHCGTLPQILQLSGMDRYVFLRPGPEEKSLPSSVFLWQGPDGSTVTAARIPIAYARFGNIPAHIVNCAVQAPEQLDDFLCFYGVGNHGGGPTKQNIEQILSCRADLEEQGIRVEFSSPDRFFDTVEPQKTLLPIVSGDLQYHSVGCYSVFSKIKQLNRRAENRLISAEKWSVVAARLGLHPYPENFGTAWENLLFNQFHDILAGTCVWDAYEDIQAFYGESLSIAAKNGNQAAQAVSFRVNIPFEPDMVPLVVFNPCGFDVEAPVEFETAVFRHCAHPFCLAVSDSESNPVPHQFVVPHSPSDNQRRVVFTARIPSLGYAIYQVKNLESGESPRFDSPFLPDPFVLENSRLRAVFNPKTGGMSSLLDKETGAELLGGEGALLRVMEDHSDTWSHHVERYDRPLGFFESVSVSKTEDGPVRSAIRVVSRFGSSRFEQTFSLYAGEKEIRIGALLDLREPDVCLKLEFPLKLENCQSAYSVPFGSISRENNGHENPMLDWVDLTGLVPYTHEMAGLSLISDCKYAADVDQNRLRLTVARNPVFAHHAPHVLGPEDTVVRTDDGLSRFSYRIVPHRNSWKQAGIARRACEMNQPPVCVVETCHSGPLSRQKSYFQVDRDNLMLTALKKAHLDGDWILRLVETAGRPTRGEITFFDQTYPLSFRPYEIKTLKISTAGPEQFEEVNFLEEPLGSPDLAAGSDAETGTKLGSGRRKRP